MAKITLRYIVEKESASVKEYLREMGLSRKSEKKVKTNAGIFINHQPAKNCFPLNKNDLLELVINEEENPAIKPSFIPLRIKYEDEYLLMAVKPRNLASQPSRKHLQDNLISAVKYYFNENNITSNIHLVGRLDYATSGLVIVAKDGITHYLLKKTNITRKYLCHVAGRINSEGVINLPIAKEDAPSIKSYVTPSGKTSTTRYRVIDTNDAQTLVEAELLTGRTHQIRVHFSAINHPVIGDELYGTKAGFLHLHCYKLSFKHPYTKREITVVDYPDWHDKSK